ncbi:type II toxin-antitoxin system CcdA family antitoxin [Pararhizobium sp.]
MPQPARELANLSLDSDLVSGARDLKINISRATCRRA